MARKWWAFGVVSGLISSVSLLPRLTTAQEPIEPVLLQGRPAASVPSGPNEQIIPPEGGGVPLYETQRVKHTPTLDPTVGLEGNWDPLYSVREGTGIRTGYFNWDETNLYLAQETPEPTTVRFDLDMKDDGWLRGADNLAVQVEPFTGSGVGEPAKIAYRFDTVQNRDQPVWALAPIPQELIRVRAGRTPRGTYAVIIIVPLSEEMGLIRKAGSPVGVRFEAGNLPDPATETGAVTVRSMLRLVLQDSVPAQTKNGLIVRVNLDTRDVTQGEGLRATLEVTNPTQKPQKVGRMFLRGYLYSSKLLDESKFTDAELLPGKSLKRELRSNVSPGAPLGAIVFSGGVEAEGGTVVALTAFDRVEPYRVILEMEARPVFGAGETRQGDTRQIKVMIRSQTRAREKAVVRLSLPNRWVLQDGKITEERILNNKNDVQGIFYKVLIPTEVTPNLYTITVTVEIGGRVYKATDTLLVTE